MNIGDMVIIKECHKIPDVVGKEAKVILIADPELAHYPIQVILTEEITITMPWGDKAVTKGPFLFREDELEVHNPPTGNDGIPPVFLDEAKPEDKAEPESES